MAFPPLTKIATPNYILALFDEIDRKVFGESLDVLADDVDFRFGVGEWHGREAVRENLRKFDTPMDTAHTISEFWDGGPVKMFRGEITATLHASGKTVRPAFTHFIYMDAADPTKIRSWYGAVGPLEF